MKPDFTNLRHLGERVKPILFFCRRIYLYNFFITLIFLVFFLAYTILQDHLLIIDPVGMVKKAVALFLINTSTFGFYASLFIFHNFNRGEWNFYYNMRIKRSVLLTFSQIAYLLVGGIALVLLGIFAGIHL